MRSVAAAILAALTALAACADSPSESTLATFPDSPPGAIVALRAAGDRVEYADRLTGELWSLPTTPSSIPPHTAPTEDAVTGAEGATGVELLATVPVSTEGEQRGFLGHTMIGGRRFAAWTEPETFRLIVGEITSGSVDRIVWVGTGTQSTAIGGHLDTLEGQLVLGLGSLTDWAIDHGSGALVTLDPDGPPDQQPAILSDGWNNPFAFIVDGDAVWVADNSPDGSDLPPAERAPERIGRADIARHTPTDLPLPQRAASALVVLPDGRLGVCGFLDGEMWAYDVSPDAADDRDAAGDISRAGTIGPCLTGAALLADGSVITASTDDDGASTLLLRTP